MSAAENDRAGFLQAIVEQPDDDLPRLVFADALQHGDGGFPAEPERAEFIRIQVANPHSQTWYNGAAALANRTDELLRRNGHEWLGPYYGACNGRNWTWHRGLVSQIICTWADWTRHATAIRKATPLERVKLTTWPQWEPLIPNTSREDVLELVESVYKGVRFELPPYVEWQPIGDDRVRTGHVFPPMTLSYQGSTPGPGAGDWEHRFTYTPPTVLPAPIVHGDRE